MRHEGAMVLTACRMQILKDVDLDKLYDIDV